MSAHAHLQTASFAVELPAPSATKTTSFLVELALFLVPASPTAWLAFLQLFAPHVPLDIVYHLIILPAT